MKKASDIAADTSAMEGELSPAYIDQDKLDAVRSILLAEDRERIEALAAETAAQVKRSQEEKEALLARISELQAELDRLRELNRSGQAYAEQLQHELDHVRQDISADQENRIPFLVDNISGVLSTAAQESHHSLARSLSPVMGEAISNQIRDSQDEMVDALQPIILRTVQKAIATFARDLQRNIDIRLKVTLGPAGILRSFWSRLRGFDDSERVVRDSLPFALNELFLIQGSSGLLVEYDGLAEEEPRERDLISGMLTAIRDFAQDSFGDGETSEELDEVQYGDQRIIIEGGTSAYVAAVIRGVEPEGFRASLRDFVANLHLHYGQELREFDGDPAGTLELNEQLADYRSRYATDEPIAAKPMPRGEKWLLIGGGIAGVVILALACFYLQFTIALLPVAFGETPTATTTVLPTATSTPTAENTPTYTPEPTQTNTATPEPSSTATASATPLPTPEDTATPTAVPATLTPTREPQTLVNVWARSAPGLDSPLSFAIVADSVVSILNERDEWLEVEVLTADGLERGWVFRRFVDIP